MLGEPSCDPTTLFSASMGGAKCVGLLTEGLREDRGSMGSEGCEGEDCSGGGGSCTAATNAAATATLCACDACCINSDCSWVRADGSAAAAEEAEAGAATDDVAASDAAALDGGSGGNGALLPRADPPVMVVCVECIGGDATGVRSACLRRCNPSACGGE